MPSKKKSANGTKNGRGAKGSRGKADTRTKSEDFTARLGEKAVETVERKVVSMPSSPARNGDGIGKEERRALDSLDNVGTIEETNTTSKPRLSPCKTPALDSENELVNGACLSNLEDSLPSPASPASDHATVSSHYRTYTHSSDAGSEIGANSHGFADQDAISQVSISDVEDGEAETFLECEDADDESDAGKIAKKDSPKGEREVVKSGVKSKFRAPHCKLSEDGESWAAHSVAPSKRTASVANLRRTGSRSPSESFADMETNGVEKSPADGKRFRVDDSEDKEAGSASEEPVMNGADRLDDPLTTVQVPTETAFPLKRNQAISRARGERIAEALHAFEGTQDGGESGSRDGNSDEQKCIYSTWTPGDRHEGKRVAAAANSAATVNGTSRSTTTRRRSMHLPVNGDYFKEWSSELKQNSAAVEDGILNLSSFTFTAPITEATVAAAAEPPCSSSVNVNTNVDEITPSTPCSSSESGDRSLRAGLDVSFDVPLPLVKAMDTVDAVWQTGVELTARGVVAVSMGLVKPPTRWLLQGIDAVANRVARVSVPLAAAAVLNARSRRY